MNHDDPPPKMPPDLPIPLALWGVFPWVPPYVEAAPEFFVRPPPRIRTGQPRIDITGERHGALVASSYDAARGRSYWNWACDCGGSVTQTSDYVRQPNGPRDCGPECPQRGVATP